MSDRHDILKFFGLVLIALAIFSLASAMENVASSLRTIGDYYAANSRDTAQPCRPPVRSRGADSLETMKWTIETRPASK